MFVRHNFLIKYLQFYSYLQQSYAPFNGHIQALTVRKYTFNMCTCVRHMCVWQRTPLTQSLVGEKQHNTTQNKQKLEHLVFTSCTWSFSMFWTQLLNRRENATTANSITNSNCYRRSDDNLCVDAIFLQNERNQSAGFYSLKLSESSKLSQYFGI